MAIEVICHRCSQEFTVRNRYSGQTYRCERCRAVVRVPELSEDEWNVAGEEYDLNEGEFEEEYEHYDDEPGYIGEPAYASPYEAPAIAGDPLAGIDQHYSDYLNEGMKSSAFSNEDGVFSESGSKNDSKAKAKSKRNYQKKGFASVSSDEAWTHYWHLWGYTVKYGLVLGFILVCLLCLSGTVKDKNLSRAVGFILIALFLSSSIAIPILNLVAAVVIASENAVAGLVSIFFPPFGTFYYCSNPYKFHGLPFELRSIAYSVLFSFLIVILVALFMGISMKMMYSLSGPPGM
ncbi:Hypothetical protein PBC10988_10240 [Planctomycetales bacterium 10988]|nr:Hypothetical protein PBC10988_10240 [Planctomycetales bacterium 10988]